MICKKNVLNKMCCLVNMNSTSLEKDARKRFDPILAYRNIRIGTGSRDCRLSI